MRKAIGDLVTYLYPSLKISLRLMKLVQHNASEDVKTLQEQVAQLTEMVQSMALASKGFLLPSWLRQRP